MPDGLSQIPHCVSCPAVSKLAVTFSCEMDDGCDLVVCVRECLHVCVCTYMCVHNMCVCVCVCVCVYESISLGCESKPFFQL